VEGVALIVEDSGPGIPEASYTRVFDRFYRLGGDRHASNTIGSGLGLSIVDHIVRLHRGEISLSRSQRLGGLQVTVWLPQQIEGAALLANPETPVAAAARGESNGENNGPEQAFREQG
jgi:signal transduction histidine kinase